MQIKKIILVFKTHFDIGFTDLSSHVIKDYAGRMLHEVIETCEATAHMGDRRFVWTMPAWPLWHIVNHCSAEDYERLERLIQNGQVVWHALPFTSHTDFATAGEYAQGLRYSRLLAERYQKQMPIAAKMTDVPGHSLMLPDILSQAGVRFLHLGCNEFATPPAVPGLFCWEAPGGRRVLTMYSKGGYGTELLPPEDWEYPVWMALMNTHDNSGPQSAEVIGTLAERAKRAYPEAEVVCGTMDDFCRELEKCDLSTLPVVKSDLADTWIHGVGSYPKEVAGLRENRRRAQGLEQAYARLLLEGQAESDAQTDVVFSGEGQGQDGCVAPKTGLLQEAERLWDAYYDSVTMFEEHTWGADVKTFLGPERVYEKQEFLAAKEGSACRFMECSWQEQRERVEEARQNLEKLEALLSGAGKSGLADAGHEPVGDAQADGKCGSAEGAQGTGDCPETSLSQAGQESFSARPALENHRYRLEYDPAQGRVLCLYDKALGTVLLQSNGKEGLFSYQYDRYGYDDINEYLRNYGYHFTTWGIQDYGRENYPFCDHRTFWPEFVRFEKDENRLVFHYSAKKSAGEYGDAGQITLTVTLPEDGDGVYVELFLKDKQESPFVEAGSLLIPSAGENVQYRIRKGGILLNPRTDIVEKANHSLYCVEDGVMMMDEGTGVWVESLDAPLVSIGDPGVYRYAPVFEEPKHPTLYVNLFNNMWGTNFPQWIGGDLRFRFILRGFAPAEAVQPGGSGTYGVSGTPGRAMPADMKLLFARKREGGILLTLQELSGRGSERTLRAKGYQIAETTLFGEAKGKRGKDSLTFEARPYALHSFYLCRTRAEQND